MNLFSQGDIKDLLARHQAKPLKLMGQHFLISQTALDQILKASEIGKEDTVLEVGPGIGNLTQALAKRAKKVIAVEKDRSMVEILKETLVNFKNVEIVNNDILKINFQFSMTNFQSNLNFQLPKKYKVVANLPYYISSPIIRKFLEAECPPETMVLMMQKEVAQRICSKPPSMSLLAVSVQFYAKAEIIAYVSNKNFWPSPEVDSAVLKVSGIKNKVLSIDMDLFFKIVKAGFSAPRKQLVNNLATLKMPNGVTLDKKRAEEWLRRSAIKPNQRAQTLSVDDWILLTKHFGNF